jgi:hypothetical protein
MDSRVAASQDRHLHLDTAQQPAGDYPDDCRKSVPVSDALAAKTGWHRRCDDGKKFLSLGPHEITQDRTAKVTDRNPFRKASSPWT